MSSQLSELKSRARHWASIDPDHETRGETERMLAEGDEEALKICFGARLQFGTAGLRGKLGPGPSQMNRVLVRQVAAGLGDYVKALEIEPTVVIGFDGRKNSRVFAEDSASVLGAQGFKIFLYGEVVPTPVLSHSVVELGASIGIMVTASHNPSQDNGYKVYWSNGAQIVPPHDTGISTAIDRVSQVPFEGLSALREQGSVVPVPTDCLESYYAAILDLRVQEVTGARAVYSAMHGVGGRFVVEALRRAGHTDLVLEPSQFEPDADFPTVVFPNPEEEGAMDRSLALALEVGADLVLANDPDADRLAVAARRPDGSYQMLSGNEIGLLLAETLMQNGGERSNPMLATTIVSSTMLRKIAESYGAVYAETLTGFKWIANRAIDHGASGGDFVIGFEEALGYSIGPVVRDKDGVSALLLFLDFASAEKEAGRSVLHALEDLYRRYGLHLAEQVAIKLPGEDGARRIESLMSQLREACPSEFGGVGVAEFTDLLSGIRRRSGQEDRVDLPVSNVLGFRLEDGSRILARPSGTEPKIKFYFEVQQRISVEGSLRDAQATASARLADLKAGLLKTVGL